MKDRFSDLYSAGQVVTAMNSPLSRSSFLLYPSQRLLPMAGSGSLLTAGCVMKQRQIDGVRKEKETLTAASKLTRDKRRLEHWESRVKPS